ncbi:MAG: hypothetical protein ACOCXO_00970 [Bacteroidota bacterium]
MHEEKINKLIRDGYDFNMSLYFDRGLKIFTSHLGPFVGYAAIYIVIFLFAGISGLGSVASLVVSGPLVAGFFIVANALVRGEKPNFEMFFQGFHIFLPLFLASLLVGIFTAVGTFLLIIPGIYLAVAYTFTVPFIVFLKYDFWDAMEASRKLITKNFWPFLAFLVVILLINFVGVLILGVGLLFPLPATYCMIYAAFEDIVGGAVNDNTGM